MTALDPLVPRVPPAQRSDVEAVEEIDTALEEAFAPESCGYCGRECEGHWCSSQCRAADSYDGQHEEER